MTNLDLVAAAKQELEQTTVSGKSWVAGGRKPGHWKNAYALLDQIVDCDTTPGPPPPAFPVPPAATVASGPVFLRDNDGASTKKLHVASSSNYGIGNMVWPPKPSTGDWILEDCEIDHVAANPPRSMDGRGEAGFWIGQRTKAARLAARDCAWMGMWTGAMCDDSDLTDFDLSGNPHVGLYVEHVTRNTRFARFKIDHPGDGNAVNVEWWYQDVTYGPLLPYAGKAGSYSLVFEDFDITVPSGKWAFFLDAGTFDVMIRNGVIRGAGNGIAHPKNLADPAKPNRIDWASIDIQATGTREWMHANTIG